MDVGVTEKAIGIYGYIMELKYPCVARAWVKLLRCGCYFVLKSPEKWEHPPCWLDCSQFPYNYIDSSGQDIPRSSPVDRQPSSIIDVHMLIQNGNHYADNIFKLIFMKENRIFIQISLEFVPCVHLSSTGSDNGSVPNMRQAIISTNGCLVYWRIYVTWPGWVSTDMLTGLIPGVRPANERSRYKVKPSLIGWAQA